MPDFQYTTRDAGGLTVKGTLAAPSVEALTAELRARGLLVLDVETVTTAREPGQPTWNPRTWLGAMTFDVEMGFQQLATMLRGGLGLLAALRTVADQARRPRVAALWHRVAGKIEQGATFAGALEAQGRVFSPHVVQLARVGEATGELDVALGRAAEHLERARQLRITVINALAYPATVVVLACGVAIFLVAGVIPKIQRYLGGRGRELPVLTQWLLDASAFVQAALPYAGVCGAAAVIALVCLRRWPPGRLAIDRMLLRLPVAGAVLRLAGTATVARGLGTLIESGVTLLDALGTAAALPGNQAMRERLVSAREIVLRGGTLAGALAGGSEFMPMLPRMVAVGESAGTLASVLAEVARFHEAQLLATVRRLSVLIEPVVIVVVGGIVGFVYIAFFLALFSLAGRVR